MPHPGFEYARRSSSTLRYVECPREGYLGQILGIRSSPTGDFSSSGPLGAGSVFHTLQEVWNMPEHHVGRPLRGTDGMPVLTTPEEVVDYYLDTVRFAPSAIVEAKKAFDSYVEEYGLDDVVKANVVDRPEPNINAHFGPEEGCPYSAQIDLVIKHPSGRKEVCSVEHKLLKSLQPKTIPFYGKSGQIIGQAATWNARQDLVDKFGPMMYVWINISFKSGRQKHHREKIFIPLDRQREFVKSVRATNKIIDTMLAEYYTARKIGRRDLIEAVWPKLGMARSKCVGLTRTCRYIHVCTAHKDAVDGVLYQITESGRRRAEEDGLVLVDSDIKTWSPE